MRSSAVPPTALELEDDEQPAASAATVVKAAAHAAVRPHLRLPVN